MTSIKFPNIFTRTVTNTVTDLDATYQNLSLVLGSAEYEMFGDPGFGSVFKNHLFDSNDYILEDVLIDDIYTKIAEFIPQLRVTRDNISIVQDGSVCHIYIKGLSLSNYKTNLYDIVMTS